EEYHPAEYAALWGSDYGDNMLYYNCSEQIRPGKVVGDTEWTKKDWVRFIEAINIDLIGVEWDLSQATPRWTKRDLENLLRLRRWADECARLGPISYVYFNGESGEGIVRVSEAVAFGCSGSGAQDANIAAAMPNVTWLADDETIKKFLKSYGAWDDEEL